jgi:hypothetical protein
MRPPFDLWTAVISARLADYTGRTLADAPAWMVRALPEWHRRGWAARDVAERLADCRWPARATVERFYVDQRSMEILARMK